MSPNTRKRVFTCFQRYCISKMQMVMEKKPGMPPGSCEAWLEAANCCAWLADHPAPERVSTDGTYLDFFDKVV